MSNEELEYRLAQVQDKKLATEVRQFLVNLFVLFDNHPPEHIQACMSEIMDLLEAQRVPVRVLR